MIGNDLCLVADTNYSLSRQIADRLSKTFELHLFTTGNRIVHGVDTYMFRKFGGFRLLPDIIELKHLPGRDNRSFFVNFTRFTKNMEQRIAEKINELSPELVHGHYLTEHAYYASLSGVRCVSSAWGSDIYFFDLLSRPLKERVLYTIRKSVKITVPCMDLKERIIRLGCPEDKVTYLPFGIDTKMFSPTRVESKSDVVLSTRQMKPVYDIPTIIIAAKTVVKERPNVKFLFVGDGPLKNRMIALSSKLGISENTVFMGEQKYERIPDIISSSSIFVSTALSDSMPISVMEAMSMEKPAIATDVGGLHELVEDGKNGFLVPIKSPDRLAEKILFFLDNPKSRNVMGRKARRKVLGKFDREYWFGKLEKLYRSV